MAGGGINSLVTDVFGSDTVDKDSKGVQQTGNTGTVDNKTTGTTTQDSTQQIGTVTAGTSRTNTSMSGTTQALSDAALADIQGSLDTASKTYSPADLSSIAQRLQGANNNTLGLATIAANRAAGADASLGGGIDDIINAAKINLNRQLNAKQTQLAAVTGSSFNSVLQDVFARDTADANIQLAGLKAQLLQSSRAQATQEISAALAGLQGVSSSILNTEGQIPALAASVDATRAASVSNLANALKAGKTTSSQSTDSNTATRNETQQTINAITQTKTDQDVLQTLNTNTNVESEGTTSQSSNTSLTDILNALKNK